MPTALAFTSAQLTEISRLAGIAADNAASGGSAAVGAYAPMYNYIAQTVFYWEQAEFQAGRTPDPAAHLSWVWFTGAVGVNSDEGAFSTQKHPILA
jgi:hypothetical protein